MIADRPERSDERIGAAGPELDQVSAEAAPLIPPGLYDIRTVRLDRRKLWGAAKSMVSCEVVGGEYDGICLIWCANSLPKGSRRVPISSKMYRTIVMVLGRRPERGERISEGLLVHKMFRASVRTVTKGADGHELPPGARYSVIDAFVERIA